MSNAYESTVEARVTEIKSEHAQRQVRAFMIFAFVEGPLFVIVGLLTFVFKIIEEPIGIGIFFAIAMIGGFVVMLTITRMAKAKEAAIARARGENPLF